MAENGQNELAHVVDARREAIEQVPRHAPSGELAPAGTAGIQQLLAAAVDRQLPVEAMEKLVTLYERMADRQAAQEFAAAMAAFQAECPAVKHSRTAKFATKSGQGVEYSYAELPAIAETIRPFLHKHGLTYRWNSTPDGKLCQCIVRHENGHEISSTFPVLVDDNSLRSSAQNHAAALTYARRQSLVQALGLTSADSDIDGRMGHSRGPSGATVTAQQANDLRALAMEAGADEGKFLQFMKVASWEEIPAAGYAAALKALEAKRKQQEAKAR